MQAGITAITELTVKSGLTNRLPPVLGSAVLEVPIKRSQSSTCFIKCDHALKVTV
jgi:hypothetical protein